MRKPSDSLRAGLVAAHPFQNTAFRGLTVSVLFCLTRGS